MAWKEDDVAFGCGVEFESDALPEGVTSVPGSLMAGPFSEGGPAMVLRRREI